MDVITKLLRFCLVGGTVTLIYIGLYAGLRRLGQDAVASNLLALGVAVAVQYAGQACITFKRPLKDAGQAFRFSVMIGAGLVTSSAMAWMLAPLPGVADWAAATFISGVLAIQNFVFMQVWVFARACVLREDLS